MNLNAGVAAGLPIYLQPHEWEIVAAILRKHVPGKAVWAFGSRATGRRIKRFSDLDLAVEGRLEAGDSGFLDEAFDESSLPIKVDVVQLGSITQEFRAHRKGLRAGAGRRWAGGRFGRSLPPTSAGLMANARVIGSGPNGLAAAITLARGGVAASVFERSARLGGGCSTAEVTLPGFQHDLGSSCYPMGVASPFFKSLPFAVPWIEPPSACAHPFDDGTAAMLEHSIDETTATLDGEDRAAYRALVGSTVEHFGELIEDILGPVMHVPKHAVVLARFGLPALLPAATLARWRFKGARARALFAGMAAHSVLPLEEPTSAAVGLVLMAAGHAGGWPVLRGGGQTLTDLMVGYLESLGGDVHAGQEVTELGGSGGGGWDATLADVTPRQLLQIGGDALPQDYRRQLQGFQYGAGAFKVDYALSEPIPWTAKECGRAATVHLGGTLEEVAESERTLAGELPFVLLVQPSLFDPTRAPAGKHTAWAYCHVPNGAAGDCLEKIERQIERFAPGFRECVLGRAVWPPATLEHWNPNLVGGDLGAGAMTPVQLVFRPTASLYDTPVKGLYLCGASTPPGGGVHGMAGFHAASRALRYLGR